MWSKLIVILSHKNETIKKVWVRRKRDSNSWLEIQTEKKWRNWKLCTHLNFEDHCRPVLFQSRGLRRTISNDIVSVIVIDTSFPPTPFIVDRWHGWLGAGIGSVEFQCSHSFWMLIPSADSSTKLHDQLMLFKPAESLYFLNGCLEPSHMRFFQLIGGTSPFTKVA